MASELIGTATSGKGKRYEVKWDHRSGDVYVSYSGWTLVGKAAGAAEAIRKSEAWLHDK